jgi:CBS domain-containing protein
MLASTTIGPLVADKTHTFTASNNDSIETVLGKLCVHDLLSLPIVDAGSGQLLGTVSILDLLVFLAWGPYFESGELDKSTATSLKNLDRPITQLLGLTAESRRLWIAEPTMTLTTLLEPFSKGIHRVLVPQKDDDGKSTARILSQSDVVSYIYRNKQEIPQIISKKLSELGIKPKPVISISKDTSALEGFKTMTVEKVAALAITDNNNKLIGNLSASDLRGITTRRLKKVVDPVTEFLETMHGALRDPITITLNDTLEIAMFRLVDQCVHRLWVVDDNKKPIGCVSLTDIIRIFG